LEWDERANNVAEIAGPEGKRMRREKERGAN
jgi:hypothetical protein